MVSWNNQKIKKKWALITAISMLMAVICVFLPDLNPTAYGFTATTGTIIDGPVMVRKEPVNGEKITTLNPGATVTVTDEVQLSLIHI